IFQDEVRETLSALQTNLNALFADATDLPAARALERIYHTLKGAAATVGLEAVSEVASGLQDRMEAVVDDGKPVTPELLGHLVSETGGLLDSVGLTGITLRGAATSVPSAAPSIVQDQPAVPGGVVENGHRAGVAAEAAPQASTDGEEEPSFRFSAPPPPPPPPPPDDETSAEFARELRDVLQDAARLVSVLEAESRGADDTNGAKTSDVLAELGDLLHRLKGSALIASEDAIAREAATLRRACDGETEGDTTTVQVLREGLERIAAMSGIDDSARGDKAPSSGKHHPIAVPDPELWHAFNLECAELLETIDARVLELETSDSPRREIEAVLPNYHTLKGVLNTLGMTPTGNVIHRVEDFLEGLLKATVLPPMRVVTTFLLQVQVEVRRNLKQAPKGSVEVALPRVEAHLARVLSGRGGGASGRGAPAAFTASAGASEGSRGESGASARSANEGALARNFVRVGTDRLDQLMDLAGELVVSRSRLMSRVQGLRAVQLELGRGSRRLIETVHQFCEEHEFTRLDARVASSRVAPILALAAGAEAMSAAPVSALVPASSTGVPAGEGAAWGGFSELELDRYEDLQVLARSLTELTSDFEGVYSELAAGLGVLSEDSDAFGGIVSGIQSEITRARMVPMEVLFTRLRLGIRDAAMREGKEVRISTHGESVRLDKTIADALFQPMLHLVRNAVAHGFEKARDASGKPRANNIELRVREELGQVVIEVRDDGVGLNLERLRAQGIAMGLIGSDVSLHDQAVKDLVFAPGLSTTRSARQVAGRGLGCDIVKRAVERMNGSIHVESEPGKGTCFVLTLPLTLAITKALLVRQGNRSFAVPLYFAERIFHAAEQEIVESAGVRRMRLDDSFQPLYSLGGFLEGSSNHDGGAVLVIRSGAERLMLQVDAIVGQEEIVVKSLGAVLTGHPLFAGVTIRGTGEMVLILDIPGLMEARQSAYAHGSKPTSAAVTTRTEGVAPSPKKKELPRPRALPAET
ncbi:MAG TPA: Hpt domain-containing protein, partial [Labilithrix sp.]|nr:Hpt domain-containing protein [Labilithrix sp.]